MALFKSKTKNQPRQARNQPVQRSTVNTYYRGDSHSPASPFAKQQPKRQVRKYVFGLLDIILLAAAVLGILYALALNDQPNIAASSSAYHDSSVYRIAAAEQLNHLKNRNKITFDQQGLAQQLQHRFPEIISVQTELPLFSEQPTVRLAIAPPAFFLNSQGRSYIVSAAGKAVSPAQNLPRIQDLVPIQDQSGYRILPGQPVLSSGSVGFINTVIAQCRRAGIPIATLTLPPTPQELDLRTKDQSYYVKFYLNGDALTETGQFLAARAHFKQTGQPPAQYLDVRVAGKVFLK
jgi:hypothetical protein